MGILVRDYGVYCSGRIPNYLFDIGTLLHSCCCMQASTTEGKPSLVQLTMLHHLIKGSADIALAWSNVQRRIICRLLQQVHEANLLLGSDVHGFVCATTVPSRFVAWGEWDCNIQCFVYGVLLRQLIDVLGRFDYM